MKYKKISLINSKLAWLAIAAGFTLAVSVIAPLRAQQGGSGLSISPTRHEVSVAPGNSETITIVIKNVSGIDITAQAVVNDFEADGETGEPRINADTSVDSPNSIRKFVKNISDVDLAKDQSKNVEVSLDVPEGTAPGAYYGIIRYSALPDSRQNPDQGQVALNASVGALVLLEVPGDLTDQIELSAVKAEQDGKAKSFFVGVPDTIAVTVRNTGTRFARPFGKVSITKHSGEEVQTYELNSATPRGNVLPGASRVFRDRAEGISGFGRYKITANISSNEGGEVVTMTKTFVIVPLWLLAVIAVTALLLLGGVLFAINRTRRSNFKKR